jgi:hypothetical protein
MSERKMVKVACRIPGGLRVQLYKDGPDDGTGKPYRAKDGDAVLLDGPSVLHTGVGNTEGLGADPMLTEVDAEWFDAWLKQFANSPFVVSGDVSRFDEDDSDKTEPSPEA